MEPFGGPREDFRAGLGASAALAPWSRDGRMPDPQSWFKRDEGPERSPEAEAARWAAWTAGLGGRIEASDGRQRGQAGPDHHG